MTNDQLAQVIALSGDHRAARKARHRNRDHDCKALFVAGGPIATCQAHYGLTPLGCEVAR